LPLAAISIDSFASVVRGIAQQVPPEHQHRLIAAFERLLKPDTLAKASSTGYEGRKNRIMFKKDFVEFCHDIHSFLVLR
jgi:hypothetical protein